MSAGPLLANAQTRPVSGGRLDWIGTLALEVAGVSYLAWVIAADVLAMAALLLAFVLVPMSGIFTLRRATRAGVTLSEGAPYRVSEVPGAEEPGLDRLPSVRQRISFWMHLLPVVVAPLALAAVGGAGWRPMPWITSITLVSVLIALSASSLAFYATRRQLATLDTERDIAFEPPAAFEFASAPPFWGDRLPLRLGICGLIGLLLIVDAASHSALHQSERAALDWVRTATARIAQGDRTLSLAERIDQELPAPELWPFAFETFEFSSTELDWETVDRLSPHFVSALETSLRSLESKGTIAPGGSDAIGVFVRSSGGRVLVSTIDRAVLADRAGAHGGVLFALLFSAPSTAPFAVLFGLFMVAVLLGRLILSDFSRGLHGLERQAARLETGDFRNPMAQPGWPSRGDSLGRTAASLSRVEASIRSTLERTSSAAARVDQTVASLSGVLSEIGLAGSEQSQQVGIAHEMIASLQGQVGLARRCATELSQSIDVSSDAVIELSAAGEELSETSSVLTEKVDAVSNSLEQMIASVNQVSATTGRLAEASEETSSSMEEMASAMRAVDTSAETTANLSRDVVAKAEVGQARVVQTIEGMEAIRDATDVAERVIRGLGARTNEIGGILDVIEDVADETNLLALNAAIIAAQAGEQGKAFSVVADEIKELADRVLASTKEIGGLIRSVQEESENAIGAIEAGSASVMSGVDLSAEAGRTLAEITEASRESGTRIGEIVTSVREQTKAASHVVLLMERVRESADQIGEASAEHGRGNEIVYRSTLTMREVVEQVRRTTENQSAGFGRIRENAVGVRGAVERISGSLREQSDVCTQVSDVLERVAASGRSREAVAGRVEDAMRVLAAQAEELREDGKRFRC